MTTKRKYVLPNSREGLRAQMQSVMSKKSTITPYSSQPGKHAAKKSTKLNPTMRELEYETSHSSTESEYETTRSPNRRAGGNRRTGRTSFSVIVCERMVNRRVKGYTLCLPKDGKNVIFCNCRGDERKEFTS